jgi:hypothetical protein
MRTSEMSVLELWIRHELAVKRLYEVFAIMFEKHEEFWDKLAKQEQSHAENLSRFRTRQSMESWLLSEMQLTPELILKATEYVEEKRELATKRQVNATQAFSLAENIEKFLVDGVFSKIRGTPPPGVRAVLETLMEETKIHLASLITMQKEALKK